MHPISTLFADTPWAPPLGPALCAPPTDTPVEAITQDQEHPQYRDASRPQRHLANGIRPVHRRRGVWRGP